MNRKNHWEEVYEKKSPLSVSWYQKEPVISMNLITKFAKPESSNIIDVGGGASTLCDFLLKNGYQNITVLDLSTHALNYAKERLGNDSTKVHWITQDITNFVPSSKYDLWHDRAVYHFLTDKKDREKYKITLENATDIGSIVIIASFFIGGPTQCSGLDIVQYDRDKLQNEIGDKFTFIEEQHENHITPSGKEQSFGYFVFRKSKS